MDEAAVARAAERLAAAGFVAAEEEAAELAAAAPDAAVLERWVVRRAEGEPAAWIVGTVRFGGLELQIGPGVFVPRPQTEELARRAARRLPPDGRALDLCSGAGAVAAYLKAQRPGALVLATDSDAGAAGYAARNGIPVVVTDLAAACRRGAGFDVVTAVAPYVPDGEIRFLPADVQRHEPRAALAGGGDGLDVVRRVVGEAARLLREGGWLFVEVGGGQSDALVPNLRSAGFVEVTPWSDEEGDLRGVAARLAGGAPVRRRSRGRTDPRHAGGGSEVARP